jgi:acetyl-CoA carboxylase biotin carboxyl carrier protein
LLGENKRMPKKKGPVEKIKQITAPAMVWKGKKGGSMKTDLNYVKKLIKLLNSNNVNEIELEEEGVRIKVVKGMAANQPQQVLSFTPQPQPSVPSPQVEEKRGGKGEIAEIPSAKTLVDVHSPIVGTFYRAPSPNADPYVQVGQTVSVGNVLCVIEAMKLMNEIESEVNGKIVEICVENGQPVEYNQLLFRIEPI